MNRNANGAAMSTATPNWAKLRQSVRERLTELGYVGEKGWGWCPMHEQSGEHGPSFSVTTDGDGRDLLYCHAGCDQRELFEYVLRGIREGTLPVCSATEPPSTGSGWGRGSYGRRVSVWSVHSPQDYADWCWYTSRENVPFETELYIYRNEYGENVTAKQRWSDKHFLQLHWSEYAGWRLGLNGTTPPLYNSDRIAADPDATVWVVEGEKDADRLTALGLVATSSHGPAPSNPNVLAERSVVVVPDNDPAGRTEAHDAALRAARAGAKEVRVLNPLGGEPTGGKYGTGDGFDVSDFLNSGGTVDDLRRLAEDAEPIEAAAPTEQQFASDPHIGGSWGEADLTRYLDNPAQPEPTLMARDDGACLLYPGETAWVFGEPGCGKTWALLYACAQEIERGRHVVWFDFEGQGAAVVSRLLILGRTHDELRTHLHLVEPETPYVENMRSQLDALIGHGPTLVVFDAANDVLTLQGGRLNDPDAIAKFDIALLLPFKRAGAAVAVIDHVPKNAENREWPINSGHKMACTTVAYSLVSRAQFRPDQDGASMIVVRKDRHGNAPAPKGKTAGWFVLRNGEFGLTADLNMSELSREARSADDTDTVIVMVVGDEPGEHHTKSLADKLHTDYGDSVTTWTRRINKLLKTADAAVNKRDDGRLWPSLENVDDV